MPSDRTLTRYPRPNVAVDLALLTAVPPTPRGGVGHLAVLVQERADPPRGLALPGRFLRERQTVVGAVEDTLREKVGLDVRPARPLLLRVFDDPHRDERAWTISLAHALGLPHRLLREARGHLVSIGRDGAVEDSLPLLFDHATIVGEAAAAIRQRYEAAPDPDRLLDRPFSLGRLRALHEAVLGEPLRKDTFNRRMREQLRPVTDRSGAPTLSSSGGRPAQLFEPPDDGPDPSSSAQRRLRLPREGD